MASAPEADHDGAMLWSLSLLVWLACTDKAPCSGAGCAAVDSAAACGAPAALEVRLSSPAADSVVAEGASFSFAATVESTLDPGDLRWSWTWNGAEISTAPAGDWLASPVGTSTLGVTVSGPCGELASTSVAVVVTSPATEGITRYGAEIGVPEGPWRGLSVAPDGQLWAAGAGLIRLNPEDHTVQRWGVAEGLLSEAPEAVLAHSDGSIWVGHLGDTTRQGEHVSVNADDSLTLISPIAYTSSMEILAVFRLAEQPYGVGAGDVWMGTNEGLCVWDADLDWFDEHAHPVHPHGYSHGVSFSAEGDVWNGDSNQLSRWRYSNDGSLSSTGDLLEYWTPWEVEPETTVSITDLDQHDGVLWVTSSIFGVVRVEIGEAAGTSVTEVLPSPWPMVAYAVRVTPDGAVWIGAEDGLYRYDGTLRRWQGDWLGVDPVEQLTLDLSTDPATVWVATDAALIRVIGVPEGGELLEVLP